jgi:hypothetical protein
MISRILSLSLIYIGAIGQLKQTTSLCESVGVFTYIRNETHYSKQAFKHLVAYANLFDLLLLINGIPVFATCKYPSFIKNIKDNMKINKSFAKYKIYHI